MKVVKTEVSPEFKPITLTITFESQAEVDAFRVVVGRGGTVSDYLHDRWGIDEDTRLIILNQFSTLYYKLR